jgi:hypothetical protein
MAHSARRIIWTVLPAMAIATLMSSAAFAQSLNLGVGERAKSHEQIEKEEAQEKAWRAANQKIPDAKGARDPWGNVRPAPPAATAGKQKLQ